MDFSLPLSLSRIVFNLAVLEILLFERQTYMIKISDGFKIATVMFCFWHQCHMSYSTKFTNHSKRNSVYLEMVSS